MDGDGVEGAGERGAGLGEDGGELGDGKLGGRVLALGDWGVTKWLEMGRGNLHCTPQRAGGN